MSRYLHVIGRIGVSLLSLRGIAMKLIPKENGKSVMARSIEGIFFSTDMAAMDYEPCREEEIFFTAHWAR